LVIMKGKLLTTQGFDNSKSFKNKIR